MNLIFKPLNEEHNEGKSITMYEQYEEIDVSMGKEWRTRKFVLNVDDGK